MKLYFNLLILAAMWGGSFLFLRISSPEFGPIALIFVRTGIAALVLIPFVLAAKQMSLILTHWLQFVFLGVTSTAIPFTLFAYTSLYLPAGLTSILNATTPFFGAVAAFYFLNERLGVMGGLGLAIGFLGVYLLSAFSHGGSDAAGIWPVVSALVATFLYSISSVYVKLKMNQLQPLTVAAGSQLFSAAFLFPMAIVFWPAEMPGALAWGSTLAMGVFSTALSLVIFFRLLQTEGVTKSIAVTYLIPVFGVLWGALFLGESITHIMVVGGILVLIGVSFTSGTFNFLVAKQKAN
ncbi:DMT family transporter [Agarilytica rhodophyticola]|uniref:DMT family transporter n=1 Tax=Agarilytica rhodophyticola TaxID=1737490 RepID=UPI000B342292|nr:DMT family transporter [Agarilytica rhodophyticola]